MSTQKEVLRQKQKMLRLGGPGLSWEGKEKGLRGSVSMEVCNEVNHPGQTASQSGTLIHARLGGQNV